MGRYQHVMACAAQCERDKHGIPRHVYCFQSHSCPNMPAIRVPSTAITTIVSTFPVSYFPNSTILLLIFELYSCKWEVDVSVRVFVSIVAAPGRDGEREVLLQAERQVRLGGKSERGIR